MFSSGDNIKLTDLVDIEFLQKLQDNFALAMNVASISVDNEGPITKPSNFTDFCIKYTRGSAEGFKRCNNCDIEWGKRAAEKGEPVIYRCHTGLTDFAVPIMIDGEHIGSILAGQVLTAPPDEEKFRKIARDLGIDEDKYIEAVRTIKIIPAENVKAAAKLLFFVANAISEIAYKNKKLLEKNEMERLYIEVLKTLRSTLDINETKKAIVNMVGKALNADRCSIVEYDKQKNKYLFLEDAYISSDKITRFYGEDFEDEIPHFAEALKQGKKLLIDNKKIILDSENQDFEIEQKAIEKYNVNSGYAVPCYYKGDFLGVFSVHYLRPGYHISESEINFIDSIVDQISIAIYQARAHLETLQQAGKERLLRKIITTIRETIDLDKVKYEIVQQLGLYLKADRVFFVDYNSKLQSYNISEMGEYRSSESLKSLKNLDFVSIPGFMENIGSLHLAGKDVIVENSYEFYGSKDGDVSELVNYLREYDLISFIAVNIEYAGVFLGNVIVSYKEEKKFTDDDINFVKTVAEQASVAIHQANLYNQTKINAEREKLIGSIMTKAISSFDINEIKSLVKDIGLLTGADRCYFVEAVPDKLSGKRIDYEGEYLASPDIKSIAGYEFKPEEVALFVKMYLNKKDLILFDYDKITQDQDPEFEGMIKYINRFDLKFGIGVPFIYMNELLAVLAIEYVNSKVAPTDDELDFLRILSNQIGMTFNQIRTYEKIKKLAERETLLRTIIETIRSSIDIDFVKHEMVTQIGLFLKADRVFFADYYFDKGKYFTSEGNEYRSSDKIKTFVGYDFVSTPGFIEAIREIHLSGRDIIFSDLDEYLKDNNLKGSLIENFYRETGFIASMAINIYHGKFFYGNLVITFENKREITDEEIQMVRALADQAGIAIYQSALYKKEKEVAARETLLRKVTEAIRSSINIDKTLTTICDEVAKIFNVQRATIVEFFDPNDYTKWLTRREYKAREDIIGLTDIDFDRRAGEYNGRMILSEGKSLVINNLEESDTPDYYKKTYKKMGVKSILSSPVRGKKHQFGLIFLSSNDYYRDWTKEDVLLLESIASQIYVAIKQADLYEKQKKTAERETLLRRVIETTRSSLDMAEVKKKVIDEIGKAFKADRCHFRSFDKLTGKVLATDIEYLSSPEIRSLVNIEPPKEKLKFFMEEIVKREKGFYPVFVNEEIEKGTPFEAYMKENEIKAAYVVPIINRNDELSLLILHYVKNDPPLDEDSKKLLETIAYQIDSAFEQIRLYNTVKDNARKERTLRKVIEASRKSLILDDVLKDISKEIRNLFKIDRVSIGKYIPTKQGETFYIIEDCSSPDIKGLNALSDPRPIIEFWKNYLLHDFTTKFIPDVEAYDMPNDAKNIYRDIGVKSLLCVPLVSGDTTWGGIVLASYNSRAQWTNEQIELLEIISAQAYIAIRQSELYEKETRTAARETTLRKIMLESVTFIEIEEIIKSIVTQTGKFFKANRCFFVEIDLETRSSRPIKDYAEYLSSKNILSHMAKIPEKAETEVFIEEVGPQHVIYCNDIYKEELPEATKKMLIDILSVKSYLISPVFYMGKLYGSIVLHYVEDFKEFSQDDVDMAVAIGSQSAVMLHQAELYELTKIQAEKERALRKVIEASRKSLILKDVLLEICKEIMILFKVGRVTIVKIVPDDKYKSAMIIEHKLNEKIKGINDIPDIYPAYFYWKGIILNDPKTKAIENIYESEIPQNIQAIYRELDMKAVILVPFGKENTVWGGLVLSEYDSPRKWSEEQIALLETISKQVYISIRQSELYEKEIQTAKREMTLRKTMKILSSTLDSEEIKHKFVEIIGTYFGADRCLFAEYDKETNKFLPFRIEKLKSPDVKSLLGVDAEASFPEFAIKLKKGRSIILKDIEKTMLRKKKFGYKSLEVLHQNGVKSDYGLSIRYKDKLIGSLIMHFTKEKRALDGEELKFLEILRDQAGTALHQAGLYETTQSQAEREKTGRNLIEVLRSTMDKGAIKHLFVENIGKFLKADRVFFADYNPQEKMYLPVEKGSEYLSSSNEKSFVGYDWSDPSVREYIQPLLEKRELNIKLWSDYIKNNKKSYGFIVLFESADVKSSYNLPVIYQDKILGYFCIEFTQKARIFNEDDMKGLRNISAQAAIALYHADLYKQAQESSRSKGDFIANISNELTIPLDNIIGFSEALLKNQLDAEKQREYINIINENSKFLYDLRNNIISISQIESEDFKLNYSNIDIENLIEDIVSSVKEKAKHKTVSIDTDLIRLNLYADRNCISQIYYNFLVAAIKVMPENGRIKIKIEATDGKLLTEIEIVGKGFESGALNIVFSTFKQIDSSYTRWQKGSGIGLSIAKKLIEMHKGVINVESAEDLGTRISFTIPHAGLMD